jgi:hypothetical protein
MLSKTDSARLCFTKFLKFSGSKYSLRFRGYYFSDSANIQFASEKQYALSFLKYEKQDSASFFKLDISQKYYYESFSQGFVLNHEDFGNRKIIPGIAIRGINNGNYLYGFGCNLIVSEKMVVNAQFSFTNYNIGALVDVPLQLFKSSDNSFGIKLTPLVYYQFVRKSASHESVNDGYIDPGAGFSAGYHFNQKLYVGASYLYYFFNQYNKINLKNKKTGTYQLNEIDISLYYQLIKGISVKAGLVNGSPVFGLTLTGTFLGYEFKTKSLALKPGIY